MARAVEGETRLLKEGASRRVAVAVRGGRELVVKRFERAGLAGGVFDAARARREQAVIEALSRAGADVPRALGIRRDGRARELELEWIEDARTLDELCAAGERLTPRLARALGGLLARLHSAGLDHRDLHPGNVLVTGAGRAVAVDFGAARIARTLGRAAALRDLVSLCAGLRERTPAAWRALALEAWWDALAPELRARLAPPDAAGIERLARERRRAIVRARERRWMRGGTAVETLPGGRGLARRGAGAELVRLALARAPCPKPLFAVEGSPRALAALWRSMARLEEHGLPAPRCRVLVTLPPARAWFERAPDRAAASAFARGRFAGALLDRGLWLDGLEPGDIGESGLVRPRALARSAGSPRDRLAPWIASLAPAERASFVRGVCVGWNGPAAERRELATELAHA